MKKFVLIIYLLIIITLTVIYNIENNEYKKIYSKMQKEHNNYSEKIDALNKEYDDLFINISTLINQEFEEKEELEEIYNNLEKEYQDTLTKNEDLNNQKTSLTEQKEVLTNQYNQLLEEERKKKSFMISNVLKINQYSNGYPTGCESVALTILLNYWGVDVSVADVVSVLPTGSKPYLENGIKYGGNPYLEFIGNPTDPYSYGVYDIPIENVANKFKSGIINGRGQSLQEILNIVKQNRPVIVWSSMNMGIPHYTNSWIYKQTGEKINWLADLHAIVVIGYTEDQVITTDSLTGTIRYFNKQTFESRYNAFGKRALYY